jgi:hypothetical protein
LPQSRRRVSRKAAGAAPPITKFTVKVNAPPPSPRCAHLYRFRGTFGWAGWVGSCTATGRAVRSTPAGYHIDACPDADYKLRQKAAFIAAYLHSTSWRDGPEAAAPAGA